MDHDDQVSPRMRAPIEISLEPDLQTTVTDFLEFTEHLPADMVRSLTLIGKLDDGYVTSSLRLHELTTLWGQLPSLPAEDKPGAVKLREDISEELNRVLTRRVYGHAEAVRMADNVNRHVNRLRLIHGKLRSMLDNYIEEDAKTPVAHPKSPQATRSNKRHQATGGDKGRRPRVPRITVPGEVLAPYDVGYDTYSGGDSDSSADVEEGEELAGPSRKHTPRPRAGSPKPRSRKPTTDKPPKVPKQRVPKIPKDPKIPKASPAAIAAGPPFGMPPLSAPLKPPPEGTVPGSDDAPWLQLTQWELSKLRKRMKKNSAWIPSDTMINRELKQLGRGYGGWATAKKKAEEEGLPFEPTLPRPVVDDTTGSAHLPMGAVTLDSAIKAEDRSSKSRSRELNKAKNKKDSLSDQAAKEAEDSARRFALMAKNYEVSFQQPLSSSNQPAAKNTKKQQQRKRKRDSAPEADAEKPETAGLKRSKTETPVPIPQHITLPRHTAAPPNQLTPGGTQIPLSTTPVPIPIPGSDQSIMVGAKSSSAMSPAPSVDAGTTTTTIPTKAPADESSSSKKTNPVPQTRETRSRDTRAKDKAALPAPIKTSDSGKSTPSTTTPVETSRRPSSHGHDNAQKQGLASERARRASTARNTPAPEASLRQASKRTKRPIPGTISRTNSGGNNSAITMRNGPPKKKPKHGASAGAQKKAEAEIEIEVDEEGNVIDPNEARYCLCNRVSFGTMVMCENADSVSYVPANFVNWRAQDAWPGTC